MTKSRLSIVVSLLMLASVLSSCAASKDEAVAMQAIEEFHVRFNNLAFSSIYEEAHQNIRVMIPKEAFLESMKAMREGQGAVIKTQKLGVEYSYSTEGKIIKILVQVAFEKGNAKEEFMYYISENKAYLTSYRFIAP